MFSTPLPNFTVSRGPTNRGSLFNGSILSASIADRLIAEAQSAGSDLQLFNSRSTDSGSVFDETITLSPGETDIKTVDGIPIFGAFGSYVNQVSAALTDWAWFTLGGGTIDVTETSDGVYRVTVVQGPGETNARVSFWVPHSAGDKFTQSVSVRRVSGDITSLELYCEQAYSPYQSGGYASLGQIGDKFTDIDMVCETNWTSSNFFFYTSEKTVTFEVRFVRCVKSQVKRPPATPGSLSGKVRGSDQIYCNPAWNIEGTIVQAARIYGWGGDIDNDINLYPRWFANDSDNFKMNYRGVNQSVDQKHFELDSAGNDTRVQRPLENGDILISAVDFDGVTTGMRVNHHQRVEHADNISKSGPLYLFATNIADRVANVAAATLLFSRKLTDVEYSALSTYLTNVMNKVNVH